MPPKTSCVLCVFGKLYKALGPSGMSCYTFKCVHRGDNYIFFVKPSKFYFFISLLNALSMFVVIMKEAKDYVETTRVDLKSSARMLTICLFYLKSLALIVNSLANSKHRLSSMKGILELVQNSTYFEIDAVISEKFVVKYKKLTNLYYGFAIGFFVLFSTLCFYVFPLNNFFDLVRLYAVTYCIYLDIGIVFLYWFECSTYLEIIKQFFRHVKYALSSKENRAEKLGKLRRFYEAVIVNFRKYNRFLNPLLVIWLLMVIIILVFNMYMTVDAIIMGSTRSIDHKGALIKVRLQSTLLIVFVVISMLQQLTAKVEEITSYLFRYPICGLSQSEAAQVSVLNLREQKSKLLCFMCFNSMYQQVELLITALDIQVPVLNASDIFILGSKLIASVSNN